jgi:hypothetical protein
VLPPCADAALPLKSFPDAPRETPVDFPLPTQHSTWYALVAQDGEGRKAYKDPICAAILQAEAPMMEVTSTSVARCE